MTLLRCLRAEGMQLFRACKLCYVQQMACRGTKAFTSVEELECLVERYFEGLLVEDVEVVRRHGREVAIRTKKMRPPTMSGLANALNVSRMTLHNYSKRDEFLPVIARARGRIEEWTEEALYCRSTYRAARFNLEVNFGYRAAKPRETAQSVLETTIVRPAKFHDELDVPIWEPEPK